ncbi:hypothetical protein PSHT_07830 [Puccinia striiformis]|uniref:GH26 domain-containing protein n=1 Tax=Puccinia striiformis TaxID=27350 RepID=A0A2S4VUV0_9BASI|nr:hypothetical protein PSHT_07830 [Puccinia striiformis]
MDLLKLIIIFSLSLAHHVLGAGPAMGEVDQIYFGVWVDPDLGFQDTPALFNARLQRNASVFHIAQRMPLLPYNYTTGIPTTAASVLNYWPSSKQRSIKFSDQLCGKSTNHHLHHSHTHRYQGLQSNSLPQMGTRNARSMERVWSTTSGVRSSMANNVQGGEIYRTCYYHRLGPNLGHDYPYGQTANIDPTDMAVLDTNKNGELDKGDDPYTPYYPGDDYVDWIGISVYFKQFSRNVNWAQPPGFCADILTGIETQSRVNTGFDWYNQYCASKPNKACLIAESGAAYHSDVAGGATELSIKQAWWQDCMTNTTFLQAFPRIKLHMHFEFQKVEADIGPPDVRDYRLTNKTEILTAFQTDLTAVQNNYLWAQHRPITRPIQVNGPGVSAPSTASFSVPTLILQTARNPLASGLPTLFGVKRHSGVDKRRTELSRALCVVGASSLVLVWGLIGKSRKRAIHKRTPISTIVQ